MVFMKVLANALKSIKHQVFIKLILIQSHNRILAVMMKHVYVSKFEILDDHRAGKITVTLTGRLNKHGGIIPGFDVQLTDLEE